MIAGSRLYIFYKKLFAAVSSGMAKRPNKGQCKFILGIVQKSTRDQLAAFGR